MIKKFFLNYKNGQLLVVFSVGLSSFFLLMGFAIDSSVFFRQKIVLQNIVDGSLVAGMRAMTNALSEGDGLGNTEAVEDAKKRAETAARDLANYSFNEKHLSGELTEVTTTATADGLTLKITGSMYVPTTFLKLMGLQGIPITATGTIRRNPVIVALVLDTSGSMDPGEKDQMQQAAINFTSTLVDGIDQASVIVFGAFADMKFPMQYVTKNNRPILANAIRSEVDGITNIQAGLALARLQVRNAQGGGFTSPNTLKVIVLFTDGFPNAMTVNFSNPKVPPPAPLLPAQQLPISPAGPPDIPFPAGWATAPPGNPNYLYTMSAADTPTKLLHHRGPGTWDLAPCVIWNAGPVGNAGVFGCLNTYGYRDSAGMLHANAVAVAPTNPGQTIPLIQESFNSAVYEAEHAKNGNSAGITDAGDITIYTIGMGDPSNGSIEDPMTGGAPVTGLFYQTITNGFLIKTFFLQKIANDPAARDGLTSTLGPLTPAGINPVRTGYDPSQPAGHYFFAKSANEVQDKFQEVAQYIAQKIVE